MLKTSCGLLKVLMLMKAAIAFSLEDLKDPEASNISVFEINDHNTLSNIEIVQNYSDSVAVKNEVESIPSKPTFPKAFVEFDKSVNEKNNISVTFRWKQPVFTNRVIQKYRVEYWFVEDLNRTNQKSIDIISTTILQHKVYDVKPDTMYYFKVRAHNEVGPGPYTKTINVSTTHENPVPLLLVHSSSGMQILDMDLQIYFPLNKYRAMEFAYSALERKIYWINDKWQLMTTDLNTSSIKTEQNDIKIVDLNAPAHNLCIDWETRNLYWIQIINQTSNIMKLDITLWQSGIVKYEYILKRNGLTHLNVLPSIGYLFWMGLNSDNKYVIWQSRGNLIMLFLKSRFNSNTCSCPIELEPSSVQIDNTNIDKPLIYWTSEDRLIAADIYGCRCNIILSAGNNQIHFNYLTIDKTNIYLHSNSERLIYILEKRYALLESRENAFKRVQKVNMSYTSDTHRIIAFGKSLQPYSSPRCLIPHMKDYHVEVVTITANSIDVRLPKPDFNDGCRKYNYNLATTIYNISVSRLNNDRKDMEEFNVQTYERNYTIQNLIQCTEYTLKLALSNFYVDKLSMGLQFGSGVTLTTRPDKLNAPEDVMVKVLTPTLATVYWTPLKNLNCVASVNYEVHWMSVLLPNSTQKITYQMPRNEQLINQSVRTIKRRFFTTIQSLLPGQEYLVYVRMYPVNFSDFFTDSLSKSVYMYSEPNNLILSGVSTNGMNISWIPSVNLTIHYKLEYKNDAMRKWQIANNTEVNNGNVTYYIENLLPRTLYKFRLILRYPEYNQDFIWPSDGKELTFKTLGDIPSAPGKPTITRLPNFTYQLNWESVQAHHSQVILYRLEGLVVENNYTADNETNKNEHWNLYYNGTDNYWIITRNMDQQYQFRVRTENAYGFGEWSELSAVIDLTQLSTVIDLTQSIEILVTQYLPLILSFVVTVVIYVCYFYCYRQHKENKEQVLPSTMINIELATLYNIPIGNVQLNPQYARRMQYKPKKLALTTIKRKQITLTKGLGMGEFGEVFQGTVQNFEGSSTTPVAIKMLRKNASSQEKTKFLQEAKLMRYFHHKHVLRLLGICLDANSPWIILELMEGGDLLKYLRDSRTLQPSDSQTLRLLDLLAMCEDVARGCCYLENLHFVHRDLACRNCLISSRNRENRIVKIGDFGLSRDICRDHYYRMEGEGKVPVRWMAPESLVFGIFTTQSDVWAFGVLMWEITSLGEHPYPTKTNEEVLQYVREGGKLPKPINCPPTLYKLMQHCWSAENDRPNFRRCVENIVALKGNTQDAILRSVNIIKHSELPLSGQTEDLVESTVNRTTEHLISNDASNVYVIEPST